MSFFVSTDPQHSAVARCLAYAVFALLALLVLITFQDYGITWDEQVQNTYGQKLLDMYVSGFRDTSALHYLNLYFYGGFFDLCTAVVNLFTPFDHYATRHLMGGLLGVIGFFGAWRLTRLLAGDWAALLALGMLASAPLLYGHNFINPKDAPFAWLTVWVVYFGCRALLEGENVRRITVLGLGVSLGLALGTRILAMAWAISIIGSIGVGALAANGFRNVRWLRDTWRLTKPLLWALPIALALMAVFWPWSVTAPFNFAVAIEEFTNFPWTSQVLWDGEMVMSNDLPPAYLPLLLLYQLPELFLLGLLPAFLLCGRHLWISGFHGFAEAKTKAFLFVTVLIAAPILACIVMDPTLYNGMRHFLFLVPLVGIVAAIGLHRSIVWLAAHTNIAAYAAAALLTLGVARQAWIAVNLHPNEYVYYNALIGDLKGAEGKFELDYWGSSLAEATDALEEMMAPLPEPPGGWKVEICGNSTSVLHFLPRDVQQTRNRAEADFYIGLNGPACRDAPLNSGTVVKSVQRRGVVLSRAIDLRALKP